MPKWITKTILWGCFCIITAPVMAIFTVPPLGFTVFFIGTAALAVGLSAAKDYMSKTRITINGVTIEGGGGSFDIVGGKIIVDGRDVTDQITIGKDKIVEVRILEGAVGDVTADCSVTCGEVHGDVDAGTSVNCGAVHGDVDAGTSVICGDVGGDVDAGTSVSCGDVQGDVDAGMSVNAKIVRGDITL